MRLMSSSCALVDLTARFLNLANREKPQVSEAEVLDEPVDGVVRTGPIQERRWLRHDEVLAMVARV